RDHLQVERRDVFVTDPQQIWLQRKASTGPKSANPDRLGPMMTACMAVDVLRSPVLLPAARFRTALGEQGHAGGEQTVRGGHLRLLAGFDGVEEVRGGAYRITERLLPGLPVVGGHGQGVIGPIQFSRTLR